MLTVTLTDPQAALIRDLLTAHLTNLQGHREAISELPGLALVADEGYLAIGHQVQLADDALRALL